MGLIVSLSELIAGIRKAADIEGLGSLERHPDSELISYINTARNHLHEQLCLTAEDYELASNDIAVSAGITDYSLPLDFYKLRGVDRLENYQLQEMRPWRFEERATFVNESGTPTAYKVIGGNLRIYPSPSSTGTVRLWYYPVLDQLTDPAHTTYAYGGTTEYIIQCGVIKVLQKDRKDATAALQERQIQWDRIKTYMSSVDYGRSRAILMTSPQEDMW